MKSVIALLLSLACITSFAQTTAQQRNNSISKGINLDNWLESQGNPDANEFTEADFDAFVSAGFKTVRMPVRFAQYLDTAAPYYLDTTAAAFALIDSAIRWSHERGLLLILDNHHGWESLGNSNYLDAIERMGAMWRQLAQRYKHLNADSMFFEIINEPSYFLTGQPFTDLMQAMIDTIRLQTLDHTIIVSVPWASSQVGFNYITPFADTNLIYTFHFYTPLNFTHQGATWTPVYFPTGRPFPENGNEASVTAQFNLANEWAAQYQKPVFLGEFGVISYADSVSRCNWISLVGNMIYSANFSWAYWDWDSPGETNFSFFSGNEPASEHVVPCFGEALRLYGMEPSAISEPAEYTFSLFPVPTENFISITLNDEKILKGETTLHFYNSSGKSAHIFSLTSLQTTVNVSSLAPGIYIAEIESGGKRIARQKAVILQ